MFLLIRLSVILSPYAEVNQINELWLGEPTNREDEIIISPSQKKDIRCYQKMMTEAFMKFAAILRTTLMPLSFSFIESSRLNALCSVF